MSTHETQSDREGSNTSHGGGRTPYQVKREHYPPIYRLLLNAEDLQMALEKPEEIIRKYGLSAQSLDELRSEETQEFLKEAAEYARSLDCWDCRDTMTNDIGPNVNTMLKHLPPLPPAKPSNLWNTNLQIVTNYLVNYPQAPQGTVAVAAVVIAHAGQGVAGVIAAFCNCPLG